MVGLLYNLVVVFYFGVVTLVCCFVVCGLVVWFFSCLGWLFFGLLVWICVCCYLGVLVCVCSWFVCLVIAVCGLCIVETCLFCFDC